MKIIFDGEFAARLTQLACSEAPKGHSRWTIRLLADKLVELQIVPSVCNTLKKMNSSLISANTGKGSDKTFTQIHVTSSWASGFPILLPAM